MQLHRAQGAIESASEPTAGTLLAQGATEYLVLLAVVLIIALVAIALLGFFPGTASDAQIAESQLYWQSASPVAIVESAAKPHPSSETVSFIYIRMRNVGTYPIRITKLIGSADSLSQIIGDGWNYTNISDLFYLAAGEEKYFGRPQFAGLTQNRVFTFGGWSAVGLSQPESTCSLSGTGVAAMKSFGFEYVQYVEGQQITKREIGTVPLRIRCQPW